jgi:O-succinylbenzoate synthase
MKIVDIRLWRYRIRLKEPALTRPGLILRDRDSLLISIETEDGRVGWGEAAPLPGFSRDTLSDVLAAARGLALEVVTDRSASPVESSRFFDESTIPDRFPSLQFALATAFDALSPSWTNGGGSVTTTRLIQGSSDSTLADAAAAAAGGYRALKVKVGRQRVTDDVAWIRAVRTHVGPGIELRVDANRAWSLSEAMQFAEGTAHLDVSYLEEPLHNVEHLERLARETGLPVALDETLVNETISADWQIPEYVDVLVLKPTLLGRRMRPLIERARTSGVRAVMSSCYETGVGTAAVARASGTTGPDAPPVGFGIIAWLAEDCMAPEVDFLDPKLGASDLAGHRPRVQWLPPPRNSVMVLPSMTVRKR